ncbi:NADPH-P450 reductase [Penicillium canescens]|nr:NADPH-P450 reductase [Penicillium canescens]
MEASPGSAKRPFPERTEELSGKPLNIFNGSNSGTCKALAYRLADDAQAHGFNARRVDSLDIAKDALPKDQPIVIVNSSYKGQAPDNVAHFVSWLQSVAGKEAAGLAYSDSVSEIEIGDGRFTESQEIARKR